MIDLEASPLLHSLSAADVHQLRLATREEFYRADQVIYREGEEGMGLYVMRSGCVRITASISPTERRVLARAESGDCFGEAAVLDPERCWTMAVAEVDSAVFFIARAEVLRVLERAPQFALNLCRQMVRRGRAFDRRHLPEALEAERLALLGGFARSVVHDFKNPLTIIGLTVDMLDPASATPERLATTKARIRKQVDRLVHMIHEVLELVRGTRGSPGLALVDFPAFITQLVAELHPEVTARSIQIRLENPPPAVRLAVNVDRLTHLFCQLLQNAQDAMPGGGVIRLRFQVANGAVTAEIEDTGPGLAPEMAGRLFEPFVSQGKPHATGLGLSICKRIVEDHQGRIAVRSEPGRGAVFAVTLPLAP